MDEQQLNTFIAMVEEMRRLQIDCQKRYLGRRSSKQIKLEIEVDRVIKEYRANQMDKLQYKLF